MIPGIEALACGQLAVPVDVMEHVVQVESSRNPFAIGVVGGRLQRQPRNLAEAVATVEMLEDRGYNYSVGLAQVNRSNFRRFDLDAPEQAFDACINLRTGAQILAECLERHDGRWGDAFSCYYSGNRETGYRHGYVQKVLTSMAMGDGRRPAIPLAGHSAVQGAERITEEPGTSRLVEARTTAAASRFLPIRKLQDEPEAPPAGSAHAGGPPPHARQVGTSAVAGGPEEQFLRAARARLATMEGARITPRPTSLNTPSVEAGESSMLEATPDSQEDSNIAKDPARVF